ncbi:MAG: L-2-hydroxyglutarate oxidase [Thermoanaerobaculia bacterium]|nr:L-2-hydroxyglutarate oxidase [Thermoanaerobaculia bacterium]
MAATPWDVAVVGGGIVGLASARALTRDHSLRVVVLEAEDRLAAHQTGHNSGVIHSGLYYRPDSYKADNCVRGRKALVRFCAENDIAHEICGKLVIATDPEEVPRLDELERRGRANGLAGLVRLTPDRIRDYEPHATGCDALWVPETGIVDFRAVAEAYGRQIAEASGDIRLGHRLMEIRSGGGTVTLVTNQATVETRTLVNCGGLQCDRIARLAGVDPGVRIVPFRGEYFELAESSRHLVRNLIYPVPDPRFPFLGVHLTRGIDGSVEAGPNAVLALRREGYDRTSFSLRDTAETLGYPGFWRMAASHWRTGLGELRRSGSRRLFAESLQRFVPEITAGDLEGGGAGVRAQAVDAAGRLLDDFHIVETAGMVHVLNAPSPAATSSLAIGEEVARRVVAQLQ